MLSSTVALAAAANYPSPFIKSAGGDVAIVYGVNAAPTDFAAVLEINSHLTGELAKMTTSSTSSTSSGTTVSGGKDSIKLARSSDNINLRNSVSGVWGSTVSKDDLPKILADGVYKNKKNTEYKYDQKVTLGSALQLEFFSDSDYKNQEPSVGFNLSSAHDVLNYTLTFQTQPVSTNTGGDLVDFETTNINILGKEYYILDFKNATTITMKATLLDSAVKDTVKEGETKSVKVKDKNYDVSINFISSTKTKLTINGETTDSLVTGDTWKLNDGTYVGIRDVLKQDVSGSVGTVDFSLGTGKLEIENAKAVKLNDKSYNDVTGYIFDGTSTSGGEALDRIVLQWRTNDKAFLAPDKELVMPGFGALKLSMGSFYMPKKEVTKINGDGSYVIQLQTTIKDGDVTIPLLYTNASGAFLGIGKSPSNRLVTSNATISANILFNYTGGDRIMVATYNTSTTGESYLIRLNSYTAEDSANKTTVEYWNNGAWASKGDKKGGDTVIFGGLTLTIGDVYISSGSKWAYINTSSTAAVSFKDLYTKEGLRITLPWIFNDSLNAAVAPTTGGIPVNFTGANPTLYANTVESGGTGGSFLGNYTTVPVGHGYDSFDLNLTEEDRTGNLGAGGTFSFRLDQGGSSSTFYVDVASLTIPQTTAGATARATFSDRVTTDNIVGRVYSDLATEVWRLGPSSATRTAKITYGGQEAYADVFLTDVTANVSSTASNDTTTTTSGIKVLGSVAVSDGEVAQVTGKNLIVVGGSCINKEAANLLGGSLCGPDFEKKTGVGTGQFLIETFARTGGKVATLVAGYNAADTTAAAKYFTTQPVDTMVGKKYKGTSATQATLVTEATMAPAAKAVNTTNVTNVTR